MDPGWEAAVVIAGVMAIVGSFYALDAVQTWRQEREARRRQERERQADATGELVELVVERSGDVWPEADELFRELVVRAGRANVFVRPLDPRAGNEWTQIGSTTGPFDWARQENPNE